MADDKDIFAQVDGNLDTNPKIRKAGSFGRQVFEFVLRRNALRGFKGFVPIAFIDADYLAELLMIDSSDAVTGVTKAVTAKLIAIDEAAGVVRIVGWHESWGRRAKEGKERTREYRERKRLEEQQAVTSGDAGDDGPSQVTTGDESDGSRSEEKRDQKEIHTRVRERHPDAGGIGRRVWDYGAKVRGELAAENAPVPPWPIMHGTEHSGWIALLDSIGELLIGSTAEKAEQVCRNRIDVAAAKVRDDGEGQWFASTSLFTRNSFEHWSALDPKQFARKPAKKRATGDLIGPAPPRRDHEAGPLTPVKELRPR